MTTTATRKTVAEYFEAAPRMRALLDRDGVSYLGVCAIQSRGAWTRFGPTWHIPGVGFLGVTAGVRRWGTEKGLAELTSSNEVAPEWHAEGITLSVNETVNNIFADTGAVDANPKLSRVKELRDQAEELMENK